MSKSFEQSLRRNRYLRASTPLVQMAHDCTMFVTKLCNDGTNGFFAQAEAAEPWRIASVFISPLTIERDQL